MNKAQKIFFNLVATQSVTPQKDYEELPYIVLGNGQYINTGWIITNDARMWMKAEFIERNSTSAGSGLLGISGYTRSAQDSLSYLSSNGQFRTGFFRDSATSIANFGTNKLGVIEYQVDKSSTIYNGTTYSNTWTKDYGASAYKNISVLLGGTYVYSGGTVFSKFNAYRTAIFGFRIYTNYEDDNSLYMDLVPRKRVADGKVGMLDLVNNVFYPSSHATEEFEEPTIVCTSTSNAPIMSILSAQGWCTDVNTAYETDVVLPTTISTYFQKCTMTSFDEFQYFRSVTSISAAFANCTSMKSIILPSSITSIGNNSFFKCTALESVSIPSATTTIGSGAFSTCTSLKSVACEATTPPTCQSTTFTGCDLSSATLYVPSDSVSTYQADSIWGTFGTITGI